MSDWHCVMVTYDPYYGKTVYIDGVKVKVNGEKI